jgi:hypothetical protein
MHPSHSENELNELEQRLRGWGPATEGLDADAVMFAAGQASVHVPRNRALWPALAGAMTVVAVGLSGWLTAERQERLVLAEQLRALPPAPTLASTPATAPPPASPEQAPASYLASRRILEKGLDGWNRETVALSASQPDALTPNPPVLTVWQRNALVEQ